MAESTTTRRFFEAEWDSRFVIVRARVVFEGLVQGVFFRANTQRRALSLGLTGWVRNRADGSVEALFEGEEWSVNEAIAWCSAEQPHARVERKTVEFSEPTGEFRTFSVVH